MTTYTTRTEAIEREIIEPLGEYADDHDIDAIADETIIETGEGVNLRFMTREDLDHDDFWAIVEKHATK